MYLDIVELFEEAHDGERLTKCTVSECSRLPRVSSRAPKACVNVFNRPCVSTETTLSWMIKNPHTGLQMLSIQTDILSLISRLLRVSVHVLPSAKLRLWMLWCRSTKAGNETLWRMMTICKRFWRSHSATRHILQVCRSSQRLACTNRHLLSNDEGECHAPWVLGGLYEGDHSFCEHWYSSNSV